MGQLGCGSMIILIIIIYVISTNPQTWPWLIAALVAIIALTVWMVIASRRKSQRDLEASLLSQADALEHLGKNGFSSKADFVLQKDEKFIYEISNCHQARHLHRSQADPQLRPSQGGQLQRRPKRHHGLDRGFESLGNVGLAAGRFAGYFTRNPHGHRHDRDDRFREGIAK